MAKIKKPKTSTKTKIVTKVKRIKVAAKSVARRARKAAGVNVSRRDIVVTCAAGGVGAIGSALIVSKMPESVPDMAKNGIVVAIGAFAAYRGFKRRNKVLIGAGIGAASVGAAGLVASAKSMAAASKPSTAAAPLAAPLSAISFDQAAALNAPTYNAMELAGLEKAMI